MAPGTSISQVCILLPIASNHALVVLLLLSIVTGLVMIVLFGYLSDQKAVRVAKDQLRAYGRILTATGRYLRVSFKPLAVIILPMIALLVYGDRYLGSLPFQTHQPILLKARLDKPEGLENSSLGLPAGLAESAPAVHIADCNEVDWRLVASAEGNYTVNVLAEGQELGKQVVVSNNLTHLSECRLRGNLWQRLLDCAEP